MLYEWNQSRGGEARLCFSFWLQLIMCETPHSSHANFWMAACCWKRRHPSSTSQPEPVIDRCSVYGSDHSSAQCFLYSRSAAVGRHSKKFSTQSTNESHELALLSLQKPQKRQNAKGLTFTLLIKKVFSISSATGHVNKNWDGDIWTEVQLTSKWLPPTTVSKEL